MIQQPLEEYFLALERLKKGQPKNVQKGSKITNDSVALEAGRGKGSIKKSRAIFANLIQAIDEAATAHAKPSNELKDRLTKAKGVAELCRRDLEASLAREMSLLYELYETRKKLAILTGEKILPIRGKPKIMNINE